MLVRVPYTALITTHSNQSGKRTRLSDLSSYPRITLVMPAYNSAAFIEASIQSVLSQNYPNLEFIIIDGGSSDGTGEIIERYQESLAYFVSEPDEGMYDAIQKGFDKSTGEIMAWLNSDDLHFEWTLEIVATLFTQFPDLGWLTSNILFGIDENGLPLNTSQVPGYSREGYLKGEHIPTPIKKFAVEYIMQESTFWRRSLWEKSGAKLDTALKYAGDAELWARFFEHAMLYDVSIPLGRFRTHPDQITSALREKYEAEADALLLKHGGKAHNNLTAFLRPLARKYTPDRLRRLMHYAGLLHKSRRIRYNMNQKKWEIKHNYY